MARSTARTWPEGSTPALEALARVAVAPSASAPDHGVGCEPGDFEEDVAEVSAVTAVRSPPTMPATAKWPPPSVIKSTSGCWLTVLPSSSVICSPSPPKRARHTAVQLREMVASVDRVEHYIVGDINYCADGAHARAPQTLLHPDGVHRIVVDVANDASNKLRASPSLARYLWRSSCMCALMPEVCWTHRSRRQQQCGDPRLDAGAFAARGRRSISAIVDVTNYANAPARSTDARLRSREAERRYTRPLGWRGRTDRHCSTEGQSPYSRMCF